MNKNPQGAYRLGEKLSVDLKCYSVVKSTGRIMHKVL